MSIDVTVVIPIFNSSSYIYDTLASIHTATEKLTYEIILIDDCSDDIEDIKRKIQLFSNTKLIQKTMRTNAADSRNIGYLESKGKYVFFLDSDDMFLPKSIDNRVKFHESLSAGLIFGNFHLVSENNTVISKLPDYNNQNMRNYLFKETGDFRTSTISICKEYFKGTLFDEKSTKHQDWIYAIKCCDNNEDIHFDKSSTVVVTTNQNPNRMSTVYNFEASKYLCEKYLINSDIINNFSQKHWKRMILNNDKVASVFFLNLYSPKNTKEWIKYIFFKSLCNTYLLPISSLAAINAKRLKDLKFF